MRERASAWRRSGSLERDPAELLTTRTLCGPKVRRREAHAAWRAGSGARESERGGAWGRLGGVSSGEGRRRGGEGAHDAVVLVDDDADDVALVGEAGKVERGDRGDAEGGLEDARAHEGAERGGDARPVGHGVESCRECDPQVRY